MKIKDLLAIFIAFMLFSTVLQGQQTIVYGKLRDSIDQKNLTLVTISISKAIQPTQVLKAILSDQTGNFYFECDTGSYRLLFSYSGYANKEMNVIVNGRDSINLGIISLLSSAKSLTGVTVKATKPLIEQTIDKIIYNTDSDPSAKGESAFDILRKVPFVSIDGNDNVLVSGQSNFRVLLNGRETAIFTQNLSHALKAFAGANITKIEVITNPSAKYDAEGVGGIINIVTKKTNLAGYNGRINTSFNTLRNFFANTNLNIKSGRVGFVLDYSMFGPAILGLKGRPVPSTSETVALQPSFYNKRTLDGDAVFDFFRNTGNAEFTLAVDSLSMLSIYGSVAGGRSRTWTNQDITTELPGVADPLKSNFTLYNKSVTPTRNVGMDYIKKFKGSTEKEFSIRTYGEFGIVNTFLNSIQDNADIDRYVVNDNRAKNNQYTIQSDLILPLPKGRKLETGIKLILRKAESDYESFLKNKPSEDYKQDIFNTNNFDYQQNVYGAYLSYNFKLKSWVFRSGVRVEHTSIDGKFTSSSTVVRQNYTSLIPNIMVQRKISNAYNVTFNYSQRIQRPFINSLNPFVNNNDTLNISYGNPALRPQLTHNLSIQNRINKGKIFAGFNVNGSYSNNKIVQVITFNNSNGVSITTSENAGRELLIGLDGNLSVRFNPKLTFSLNSNISYIDIENTKIPSQFNDGIAGNVNLNTSYIINKRFNAAVFGSYFQSPYTIQGYTKGIYNYGMSVNGRFLKEKLTVAITAQRFFEKHLDIVIIQKDSNFISTTEVHNVSPSVRLNVAWSFGKLKENVSKKRGVNNDDIVN